ncbi:MAG TPA: rhodanese-like domain-containing protein [Gammaproteobacteria bacterium]|jgi:rhodanese-related sulfurtransferase|nr:rhodanese-like domain-containing protein [Gammaproteobacteria bacterium]
MSNLTLFINEHFALVGVFAVLLSLLSLVEFIRMRRLNAGVSPAEAVLLMNREHAIVLDIRHKAAYESGHIIDAISLPEADVNSASKTLEKNRNKPVIVACESGSSAQRIAAHLKQKGFNAHVLTGGMRAWSTADLPLVKG